MDQITEKLATIPLLANLSQHQRQRVARACECIFVAPGKTLVAQGEIADAAYLCLDDTLLSEYLADGAAEPEIMSVPADSIILELAMIVEAEASARFVAEGHARILKISRAKLLALLEDDPALAQIMSETLVERLTDMAQSMRDTIESFAEATDQSANDDASSPASAVTTDETDQEDRRSA